MVFGAALLGIALLTRIGRWYKQRAAARVTRAHTDVQRPGLSSRRIAGAVAVLLALIFSKYFYLASISVLHVLPDLEVSGLRATRAGLAVRLPGRSGGRDDHRWTQSAIASDASM
jgi:FSR family fosmidomycin resistance protein-like MFS transporter